MLDKELVKGNLTGRNNVIRFLPRILMNDFYACRIDTGAIIKENKVSNLEVP
jgi:hypothetical protein